MIEIPSVIKGLFNTDGIRKNIRVNFPNGEHTDLTNANIEFETVSLTESLSSQPVIKFGLCESPCLEFVCHGIPNIKGMTIKVTIEIDVSSLTAEEIAEYGQTSSDVDFTFYSVPYGIYKVKKCVRSGDTDQRKVTAYSKLAYMDWGFADSFKALQYVGWQSSFNVQMTVNDLFLLYSPSAYTGELDDETRTAMDTWRITQDYAEPMHETLYRDDVTLSVNRFDGYNIPNYVMVYINYKIYTCSAEEFETTNLTKKLLLLYKINPDIQGFRESIDALNEYLYEKYKMNISLKKLNYSSNRYVDYVGDSIGGIMFNSYSDTYDTYSGGELATTRIISPRMKSKAIPIQDDNIIHSSLAVHFGNKTTNASSSTEKTGPSRYNGIGVWQSYADYSLEDNRTKIRVPVSIVVEDSYGTKTYPLESTIKYKEISLGSDGGSIVYSLTSSTQTINTYTENIDWDSYNYTRTNTTRTDYTLKSAITSVLKDTKVNNREILQSGLELEGKFGAVNRSTGDLKVVDLFNSIMLYPAEDIYPKDTQYPRGAESTIYRSEYNQLEYDEKPTKHYDRIECTWTDANNTEHYQYYDIVDHSAADYDPDDYQTYSLTDNYFIKNRYYNTTQIDTILQTLGEKIKDFQYCPCQIEMRGLPYLETGDGISVLTRDAGFTTYVLRRVINGINSLFDNIEAQ